MESSISAVKVSKSGRSPILKFNYSPPHIPHPSLPDCKNRERSLTKNEKEKNKTIEGPENACKKLFKKRKERREICTPGVKFRVKFKLKENSCSENLFVPHSEDFHKVRCFQMQPA